MGRGWKEEEGEKELSIHLLFTHLLNAFSPIFRVFWDVGSIAGAA